MPAAHLRLASDPEAKPTAPRTTAKKGSVSAIIRSMPNAPTQHVVSAAKEKGIVTTSGYVRWRRWADGKGKATPRIKTNKPTPSPKDLPAMFGGDPPRISGDEDKRPKSVAKKATRSTKTSNAPSVETSFRRALGACIVEHGVARVRVLVDELEAALLAVARS